LSLHLYSIQISCPAIPGLIDSTYLKHNDGSLGSNNLADIKKFCVDTNKRLITTGDALYQALKSGIITLNEGDAIWTRMLDKRRKLPTASFSEYISKYQSAS